MAVGVRYTSPLLFTNLYLTERILLPRRQLLHDPTLVGGTSQFGHET